MVILCVNNPIVRGWGVVRTFFSSGFVRVYISYMYISKDKIVIIHAPPDSSCLHSVNMIFVVYSFCSHYTRYRCQAVQRQILSWNWLQHASEVSRYFLLHLVFWCFWAWDKFGTCIHCIISEMFEVNQVKEYEMNAVTLPYIRLWFITRPRGFAEPIYI